MYLIIAKLKRFGNVIDTPSDGGFVKTFASTVKPEWRVHMFVGELWL